MGVPHTRQGSVILRGLDRAPAFKVQRALNPYGLFPDTKTLLIRYIRPPGMLPTISNQRRRDYSFSCL